MAADGGGSFQVAWQYNNGGAGQPTAIDTSGTYPAIHGQNSTTTNIEGMVVERHIGTTNVLFCDGHVKAMRLTNLLELSTNPPTTGAWASSTNHAGLRYFTRWDD
jgi:prepilin-type processing-associated H-X9-DG protein